MKKWKSSLFVVLLVVFVFVCGFMVGKIDFDNGGLNDEDVNNNRINTSDEADENNNVISSSEEFTLLFVGKYNYEKIYEDIDCRDYKNLEIKADGTYTYAHGSNCAGGWTAKGNYSISENKIYLFNDNCSLSNVDGECMYANCTSLYEFNYTLVDDEVSISLNGITLEKN